jgi:hypothetical protein
MAREMAVEMAGGTEPRQIVRPCAQCGRTLQGPPVDAPPEGLGVLQAPHWAELKDALPQVTNARFQPRGPDKLRIWRDLP